MGINFEQLSQSANIFDASHEITTWPRKTLQLRDGIKHASLELRATSVSLHPQLPPTPTWAYDGRVPGPTFVVDSGDQVHLRIHNRICGTLPFQHVVVLDGTDPHTSTDRLGSMNVAGAQPDWISEQCADQEESELAARLTACCVMHLHGAPTAADSDGWTENVIGEGETADHHYQFMRERFASDSMNGHPPFEVWGGRSPMYWYHDHAMGVTRFNNYAGLAGVWLVRDPLEQQLGLPTEEGDELPLILQDRNLATSDGMPDGELTGALLHKVQDGVRECFGPATLVSGKLWPRIPVEPRVIRLRMLNGSNARYYRLLFFGVGREEGAPPVRLEGRMVQQIGCDGGLLGRAIDLPSQGLLLAPAERADVLIDFGLIAPYFRQVVVLNDAPAPFGASSASPEDPWAPSLEDLRPVPHVMRFDVRSGDPVSGLKGSPIQGMLLDPDVTPIPTDHSLLPAHDHSLIVLREESLIQSGHDGTPVLDSQGMIVTRKMLFLHEMARVESLDAIPGHLAAGLEPDANGTVSSILLTLRDSTSPNKAEHYVTAAKRFHDPATICIEQHAWHLWRILNLSPDSHPFHVHLTQLQAIGRRKYRSTTGNPLPTTDSVVFDLSLDPKTASSSQSIEPQAWKDTFRVDPGERGVLLPSGDLPNAIVSAEMLLLFGQFSQHAGRYMVHCHILEHEDADMMRPFTVLPAALKGAMGGMGMPMGH